MANSTFPTQFENFYALTKLPWFDIVDGEICVDPSVGPAIDVHTHLALSFLLPNRLDLKAEQKETEHYLPLKRPLDLDVYANKNFTEADLSKLTKDLTLGSVSAGGMRKSHTLPNLAREMRGLSITKSVLLAIDFPVLSDNAGTWLKEAKGLPNFIVFGSVHPYKPNVERELLRQKALGAKGIKVHPAVQTVLPQDRRAMRLYELCGKHGLPVFFHCGPVGIDSRLGRWLTQVEHYTRPIAENPNTTFVLGHTGALQPEAAIRLAQLYKNVHVEIASQSLSTVRTILDQVDTSRIHFGSDWPFYHQAMPLAKLLIATEGAPELRAKVLHKNAAALLSLTAN